jgi:hypothetical protein
MPIEYKPIKTSSKLNKYRSKSINGRASYATKQYITVNSKEKIFKR